MNSFYYSLKNGNLNVFTGIIFLIFGISMIGSFLISLLNIRTYLYLESGYYCIFCGHYITYGCLPHYDGYDPFTSWFLIGGIILFYLGCRTFVNMLTQRFVFLYNQEITRS